MLIGKSASPFDSDEYIFEIKFDGVRSLIYADSDSFKIFSRRQNDITDKFPEFKLKTKKRLILDAELCVLDDNGPNFTKVMQRILSRSKLERRVSVDKTVLMVFDILYFDNELLIDKPLLERKKILDQVLKTNENIQKVDWVDGKGKKLFSVANKLKLEGVVAKEKSSPYLPGKRVTTWMKIKNVSDTEFVVVYYQKITAGLSLGLAKFQGNNLLFCGEVACYRQNPDLRPCSPYLVKGLKYKEENIYVEPQVFCTVTYLEWTKNGHLRHPVFKAWRPDADRKDLSIEKKS